MIFPEAVCPNLAIPGAVSIMNFFFAHEILASLAPPLH